MFETTSSQLVSSYFDRRRTAITVIIIGENQYRVINGEKRRRALLKLGITEVCVIIISCTEEKEIINSIFANTQREKTWVTKGKEVHHLIEYATEFWPELKGNNPNLSRVYEWVALQLGYRSKDTVYKLLAILENDPLLLEMVDSGELSFELAYLKATRKEEPPLQGGLSKSNLLFKKCNCPLFRDNEGNVCPLIKKWLEEQAGEEGANVAA